MPIFAVSSTKKETIVINYTNVFNLLYARDVNCILEAINGNVWRLEQKQSCDKCSPHLFILAEGAHQTTWHSFEKRLTSPWI